MKGLLPGVRRCDLCGADGRCFNLQEAIGGRTREGAAGCVACLQAGRFGFFHITDAGYLDQNGLTWYDDDEPEEPGRTFVVAPGGGAEPVPATRPARKQVTVAPSAVDELRRTPGFPTWNEVAWPLHCCDFMVYLGTWQPRDVRAAAVARGRQARDIFMEMTDAADQRLWSDGAEEWGVTFHAFRCASCGALRGAIDLD
jgi:uncharacterized protein CbrC (UPF0167 family)